MLNYLPSFLQDAVISLHAESTNFSSLNIYEYIH